MSKEILIDKCNEYESFLIHKLGDLHNFYREYGCSLEFQISYEEFKKELTKDLEFIGSGTTCSVYKFEHHVLKLHIPYNEKLDLLSSPTEEDKILCKKYSQPCEQTGWKHPLAVQYFLCFDYITEYGMAGVQKYVDCSSDARKLAYQVLEKIDPYLVRTNHIMNMGMNDSDPVYIDWF